MGSKIYTKSLKNCDWVADAILERFGNVSGSLRRKKGCHLGPPLVTIFDQNPKKGFQKGIQKSILKKG